jgi:hypothetical protein
MDSAQPTIVEQIAREYSSGSLPPPACVNCGNSPVELRELWAICHRADRHWEDHGEGEAVFGLIGLVPFFIPMPSKDIEEIREGVDIVCPTPVRVCDKCWDEVEGGARFRWLSGLSQLFFIAAVVLFVTWMFSRRGDWEISWFWAAGSLMAALPFHMAASAIEAKWPRRIRDLVCQEDRYRQLLDEFPKTDLQRTKPTALVADQT